MPGVEQHGVLLEAGVDHLGCLEHGLGGGLLLRSSGHRYIDLSTLVCEAVTNCIPNSYPPGLVPPYNFSL